MRGGCLGSGLLAVTVAATVRPGDVHDQGHRSSLHVSPARAALRWPFSGLPEQSSWAAAGLPQPDLPAWGRWR